MRNIQATRNNGWPMSTVKPEILAAINFSVFTNMSLLASINFGIYLVLSPSHAYNTFLLAYIYFGEIILCTKFTKINGKPIFQALEYICTQVTHSVTVE